MTDREMLELCLGAFDAVLTATDAKRFLKKHDLGWPNAGNASHSLAKAMKRKLREHLSLLEEHKL